MKFINMLLVSAVLSLVKGVRESTSLKVVVLYSLIPEEELSLLTDVVCNTYPHEGQFTALLPTEFVSGFPTRCFHEVIRTSVLSEPERFSSIVNSHEARMEIFYQDHGGNMFLDTLAAAMEFADMIWTGPIPPNSSFSFVEHVIDMIPQKPLVIEFSKSLFSEDEQFELEKLFDSIVRYSKFPSYKKEYKFDITPTMQCIRHKPSGQCRDTLPADVNDFLSTLVTSTRSTMYQSIPDVDMSTDSKCYLQNSKVFGEEGMRVIESIQDAASLHEESETRQGPKIMCFTYSYEVKHDNVRAIRETWGKRCDGYLAISNISKPTEGIYAVGPLEEEREDVWFQEDNYLRMWKKTQLIISVIATSSLLEEYDFFLLGGDDLYVLVENLKNFLSSDRIQSLSDQPLYIGREIHSNKFTRFNSGGPGYVLNRASALILYRLIHHPNGNCLPTALSSMEDLFVGKCLLEAGIIPIDTGSDDDGLQMFHPLTPKQSYIGSTPGDDWFGRMVLTKRNGSQCCSKNSISFHYITYPQDMKCLDYLLRNRMKHLK